jgi:hypothetical protein
VASMPELGVSDLDPKRPQIYRFLVGTCRRSFNDAACTINQTAYARFWRAAMYSVHEKLIR